MRDYHIDCHAWERILLFLRSEKGLHTGDEDGLRLFVEGIWFVGRSGCQWRLLPKVYGNWRAVHRRFKRWCAQGIWERLMQFVSEADREAVMVDGTVVRSHACSAGYKKDRSAEQALGRSKGGFSTKIHAVVDALGNPLKFILTAGQRNEITQAEKLTEDIQNTCVIADKGYDSNKFIRFLQKKSCQIVIPPRKNRKEKRGYDEDIYKERHLIEVLFGKIKQFRRLFSRFDKTSQAFLGFLNFVGALIWLK